MSERDPYFSPPMPVDQHRVAALWYEFIFGPVPEAAGEALIAAGLAEP